MRRSFPAMALTLGIPLGLLACVGPMTAPGQLEGTPELFPEGCTTSASLLCYVSEPVSFVPAATGQLWQSVPYAEGSRPLGTTDGASIPRAIWSIVGTPYDPQFIRPAILHDNYTWPENRVRPWRETHRAFLYALLDESVEADKAWLMYYAVYTFGGHWATLVVPEDCDENCPYLDDQRALLAGNVTFNRDPLADGDISVAEFDGAAIAEVPSMDSDAAAADLLVVWAMLQADEIDMSGDVEFRLLQMERLARQRHPTNFFLQYSGRIPLNRSIAECLGLIPGGEHLIQNTEISL